MIIRFFRTRFLLLLSVVCVLLAGVFLRPSINDKPVYTVAITQIAPHPSLDEIRRGILDVLKENGIQENDILYQNAQGSPATALQIAQKFVSLRPKIIIPITTPSAQAVYKLSKEAGLSMIFSAVSDPYAARLMPEKGTHNPPPKDIAGVSDLSPIKEQLDFLQQLMPNVKTIGVLYNAGEANSNALITLFTQEARDRGLTVLPAIVMGTTNVSPAFMTLIGRVDAVYIPNDNTVISAFESLLPLAKKHKIPIFTADPESVEKGALACVAYNQYDIGLTTGKMVASFLKGDSLSALGVQKPQKVEYVLNKKTAAMLEIPLSKEILRSVTRVIPQEHRHHT